MSGRSWTRSLKQILGAILTLAGSAACGSEGSALTGGGEAGQCMSSNPWDPNHPPQFAGSNAVDVSAQCASAGGSGCDLEHFVSPEAAVCIVKLEGAEYADGPASMNLQYAVSLYRPVYSAVSKPLQMTEHSSSGTTRTIDAVTGVILQRGRWTGAD